MKNLFEIANRKKYRFPTRKGNASCEDLWDLSLQSLDILAGTVDAEILSVSKSYVNKIPKNLEDLENKLEIIKHVITTKLDEGRNELSEELKEEIKFL